MSKSGFVAAVVAFVAALTGVQSALAAEGSCGHNEMRKWVDQEEICYWMYGPLNEKWRLDNYANLGDLSDCLDAAKAEYKMQRFICELRGETPYRADQIHVEWERYRTAYKLMTKRAKAAAK